ncbi:creatininase family protein [bacterium]|nr:MAG: creatininase family protein [bacterium]
MLWSVILAKTTWTEVEALDREQVVVVPVGGTEQHGPSLPLGTSTYIAQAIAYGLSMEREHEVVVVPATHYGVSGADKTFAGSVDLGYEALIATLRAIVASMTRHRFRRFLFIVGGKSDTRAAVDVALRTLKDELPNVAFARSSVTDQSPEDGRQRAAILLATHADLVRIQAGEAPADLRLEDGSESSSAFVYDTDEVSSMGLSAATGTGAEEARAELTRGVRAASELVTRMRQGRIYVEPVP